jgi:hypothetical protein
MPTQDFILYPFSQTNRLSDILISGTIIRHAGMLKITFILSDPLNLIIIPAPAKKPLRKNRLWEQTCFEFFIKTKDADPYWEFNLSPSGDWNIYRFEKYRTGMAEETAFSTLPFRVTHPSDSLKMILEININIFFPPDQPLNVGISAVIKNNHGEITYWALAHPGPKPDFHLKDSFCLGL